jgi:hypothetical protein
VFLAAGRYDEAAAYCQGLPTDDTVRDQCLARARLAQGRTMEAIQILLNAPHLATNGLSRGFLGSAYARSGGRDEAERRAAVSTFPNEQALIYAGLGHKDRTFEALGRMGVVGPQRIGLFLNDPEFALLRGDLRVKALRQEGRPAGVGNTVGRRSGRQSYRNNAQPAVPPYSLLGRCKSSANA